MNRWVLGIFGTIGVLLLLVAWLRPSTNERLVGELLARKLCTESLTPQVSEALAFFLAGSEYAEKWQINGPPRSDYINVYVLQEGLEPDDARLPRGAGALVGNGAFIGGPQLVVLDAGFIERFLAERHIDYPPRDVQTRGLVYWILGHELGHVLAGHKPRHFGEQAFTKQLSPGERWHDGRPTQEHSLEMAADRFCLERLKTNRERELMVVLLLYSILDAEIFGKAGEQPTGVGIHFDYTYHTKINLFNTPTHPDYMLRLAAMIELAATHDGDFGTKNMVDSFQRAFQSGNAKAADPSKVSLVCSVSRKGVLVAGARVTLRQERGGEILLVSDPTDFNGIVVLPDVDRQTSYTASVEWRDAEGLTYCGSTEVHVLLPRTFRFQKCKIEILPKNALPPC